MRAILLVGATLLACVQVALGEDAVQDAKLNVIELSGSQNELLPALRGLKHKAVYACRIKNVGQGTVTLRAAGSTRQLEPNEFCLIEASSVSASGRGSVVVEVLGLVSQPFPPSRATVFSDLKPKEKVECVEEQGRFAITAPLSPQSKGLRLEYEVDTVTDDFIVLRKTDRSAVLRIPAASISVVKRLKAATDSPE